MEEVITIPVALVIIVGFASQLTDIAESSSEKAIAFADDMNAAIDCATRGIALEVCSPNLMEHDFEPEINATTDVLNDIILELEEISNGAIAS